MYPRYGYECGYPAYGCGYDYRGVSLLAIVIIIFIILVISCCNKSCAKPC